MNVYVCILTYISPYLIGQVCLRFIAICRVLQQQENEDITQGKHINLVICTYYKYTYVYIRICKIANINIYICIHIYVHIHIYLHKYVYICIHINVNIYSYLYMYAYIHRMECIHPERL